MSPRGFAAATCLLLLGGCDGCSADPPVEDEIPSANATAATAEGASPSSASKASVEPTDSVELDLGAIRKSLGCDDQATLCHWLAEFEAASPLEVEATTEDGHRLEPAARRSRYFLGLSQVEKTWRAGHELDWPVDNPGRVVARVTETGSVDDLSPSGLDGSPPSGFLLLKDVPAGLDELPKSEYGYQGDAVDLRAKELDRTWIPALEVTRKRLFETIAKGDDLDSELRAALRVVQSSYASVKSRYAPNPLPGSTLSKGSPMPNPMDRSLRRIDTVLDQRALWTQRSGELLAPAHAIAPGASQCVRGCRGNGTASHATHIFVRSHGGQLLTLEVDAMDASLVAISKLWAVPRVDDAEPR